MIDCGQEKIYSVAKSKKDFSPFDAVQLVPFHVIVANQLHPVGDDGMGWNGFLCQTYGSDSSKNDH